MWPKVSKRDAKFLKSGQIGESQLNSSAFESCLEFAITYNFLTRNELCDKEYVYFFPTPIPRGYLTFFA